jgi:hypothetical protein
VSTMCALHNRLYCIAKKRLNDATTPRGIGQASLPHPLVDAAAALESAAAAAASSTTTTTTTTTTKTVVDQRLRLISFSLSMADNVDVNDVRQRIEAPQLDELTLETLPPYLSSPNGKFFFSQFFL